MRCQPVNTELIYEKGSLGRTAVKDGAIWCSLSGSGAEFKFNGKSASVTIAGDSTSQNSYDPNNQARIAIYVNGTRVVDDMIDKPEKTYNIISETSAKDYEVKIVKLSESLSSSFAIKNINVDNPETVSFIEKKGLIEFIGDSITCGYGVDDEVKEHGYSTKTEDITKTYAFKTAEALGYGYSMVSYSGYGVISGYSSGEKTPEMTVPQYYDKLGHSNYSTFGGQNADEITFESKKSPDIIVINLGTNDSSYCGEDTEKQEDFKQGYISFIEQIRKKNPNSKIICTMGIMGGKLYPVIEKAVDEYKMKSNDSNIYSMEFDLQSLDDGLCADWHPSEKTHEKASKKLTAFIENIIR